MPEQTPPTPPTPPAVPPPVGPKDERKLGELVFDVTEGVSSLVREEIQLAKTEVAEKAGKIAKGAVVGISAGVFAFLALILVMEGIAWLLNEEVFNGKTWPGFFIEAAVFLLIAALAALIAYKAVKAGSPPMPTQAIEEAKLTKETLSKGDAQMSVDPKPSRPSTAGQPGRSAAEIRRDIDAQRQVLGANVESLRGKVTEVTDWRAQVEEHKQQLIIGAAAVGLPDRHQIDARQAPPQARLLASAPPSGGEVSAESASSDLVARLRRRDQAVLADVAAGQRQAQDGVLDDLGAGVAEDLAEAVVGVGAAARGGRAGDVDPGDRHRVHLAAADGPVEQVLERARQRARVLRRAEEQRVGVAPAPPAAPRPRGRARPRRPGRRRG